MNSPTPPPLPPLLPAADAEERQAILRLCLLAAFADGGRDDVERAELLRITTELSGGSPTEAPVLPGNWRSQPLSETTTKLKSPASRARALEMAVCVCEADGLMNPAEREFVETLRRELGLRPEASAEFQSAADGLATAAINAPPGAVEGDIDQTILKTAMLAGALELLPQSLATMGIIPLQMRLVYRIGRRYGFELDRTHLKDFLATIGVGLTSQVVEGYALKLLHGWLGRGLLGGTLRQATSSSLSFATTYALGHAAQRYYAGGRRFELSQLKQIFNDLLSDGRGLQAKYLPEIQARARDLKPDRLLSLINDV